jgi:hypothetical protein
MEQIHPDGAARRLRSTAARGLRHSVLRCLGALGIGIGAFAGVLLLPSSAGAAPPVAPPFTECPAVGSTTSCSILIVITSSGEQILQDATQGAYDGDIGAEDTMVGVVNETGSAVPSIQLSSSSLDIFGFDGDGICTFAAGGTNASQPGGFPAGSSYCTAGQLAGDESTIPGYDYQGPDNTFSNISADTMSGQVNFNGGGLAPGASTYFSLEEPLSACSFAPGCGYREVASDGGLFSFAAPFYGSMGGKPLNQPIVGMAEDPQTGGYWEVAKDGGLFAFNAPFFGSMGGKPLNQPIVGMLATPDGQGYWEVAADGGLFAFGDAGFFGSMGGQPLNLPVVGMAGTPDGNGYFEVAQDGGLFAFGNAGFFGSMGGQPLNLPIVGMAPTPDGQGYYEVAKDGGLFTFGDSTFEGSMGGQPLNAPIVGMSTAAA